MAKQTLGQYLYDQLDFVGKFHSYYVLGIAGKGWNRFWGWVGRLEVFFGTQIRLDSSFLCLWSNPFLSWIRKNLKRLEYFLSLGWGATSIFVATEFRLPASFRLLMVLSNGQK